MARVTVEKLKSMMSGFELVVLAAVRAKDISSGAPLTLERENDKDSVIALREIEAGYIKPEFLKERLIARLRKNAELDYTDNDFNKDNILDADPEDLVFDATEAGIEFTEDEFGSGFEDEDFSDNTEED